MPSNENEKKGKKSKVMLIVNIIIILLIIHIILLLSKCSVTKEEYVAVDVPRVIEETNKKPVQDCNDKEYEWDYQWGGLSDGENNMISTSFRLFNMEDREGLFEVDFAFFDESKYQFDDYEGKLYEAVEDELPWSAADMWFNGVKKTIGPNKNILITPSVEKKNPSASYWVYANVKAPTYSHCTIRYYIDETKNTTVMIKEDVRKNVTHTVSLWELLVDFIFNN